MVIQKQTLQLPHLRRMSLNYFVLRNTKRKLFLIFIYILRDREVLSANSENMKRYFNIGSRTCLRAFSSFPVKAVHWKALQSKKKRTQNNA